MTSPIKLVDAARFTENPPLKHQLDAWDKMQARLSPEVIAEFAVNYRAAPPAPPASSFVKPDGSIELPGFPYFSQLDNGSEGWRQCQTSSIAMCLRYLKVPGIMDDLDYLRYVRKYGDTTAQASHTSALRELGVKATFSTTMSQAQLLNELKNGRPCAIGVLHHGSVSCPSGGGHYIAVYGSVGNTAWRVMDPYGELDLQAGTWAATGGNSGKAQVYSRNGLNPRWLNPGANDGWGWTFG